MDPLEYLAQLQAEADHGFHRRLKAWVDDSSSVARVLRDAAPVALAAEAKCPPWCEAPDPTHRHRSVAQVLKDAAEPAK